MDSSWATTSEGSIYREFIRGGVGTRGFLRDEEGNAVTDLDGRFIPESLDETCLRRWSTMPELSRERFRREAEAASDAA